jgi:hypothetical protein
MLIILFKVSALIGHDFNLKRHSNFLNETHIVDINYPEHSSSSKRKLGTILHIGFRMPVSTLLHPLSSLPVYGRM